MNADIVLLPGDGIGPEVTAEAQRVLETIAERFGHTFHFQRCAIGGNAIDDCGSPLPDESLAACRAADAILLGAVGGPQWDDPHAATRPELGLLTLRKELELFANLRPIKVYPELADASPLRPEKVAGVDILFVRELTGGIYFGESGRRQKLVDSCQLTVDSQSPAAKPPIGAAGPPRTTDNCQLSTDEEAYNVMRYSTQEITRIVRLAAEAAQTRRGKLTSVDKANVLEVSRLWRSVAAQVLADEFPKLDYEVVLVDAMAMHLLSRPRDFDVVVTGNLFGDILTDEASMLPGSLGLLPSASIGPSGPGLYEPVHGSAPDIAGRGIANPLASILAAAMLLRHSLQLQTEALAVETAVEAVLQRGHRTADIAADGPSISTEQMGTHVLDAIQTGER